MTLAPLAFDFPLMSPLATRPPHEVPRAEMLAEVEQELADRRAFYRRLVDQGKMAPGDAERHILILAAIRDDLPHGPAPGASGAAVSWDAKVRELRRELAMRRNAWPKRLARPGDPLDPAAAGRRMERLDAVHFLYWIELFQCDFAVAPGTAMPLAALLDAARAYAWRVAAWERAAAASTGSGQAGPDAHLVRPAQRAWYADLDRGEPEAVRIWQTLEAAAARHGFVTIDQAA